MILFLKKYPVYFLFLTLLIGCANSEVEVAPWNNTLVPVVYSIITPNEPVQVYVSRTYNQNIPAVKNPYPEAKVFMSGPDSKWFELTRLSVDTTIFKDAQKQLIVEKGKTYSLKVELSDRTVHAQTTLPAVNGVITDATCETVKLYPDSHAGVYFNGKVVDANINDLKVNFALGNNPDYTYYLSSELIDVYEYLNISGSSFHSINFFTPKDSTSFNLNLITVDPYYKKYLDAQYIYFLSEGYSNNSPILAIFSSFGGVLPQFSNIVNGVGLFGNSVIDKKRVSIKPLAQ